MKEPARYLPMNREELIAECERLRALLKWLTDLEGPQPGHVEWARRVWAELGSDGFGRIQPIKPQGDL